MNIRSKQDIINELKNGLTENEADVRRHYLVFFMTIMSIKLLLITN